MVTIWHNARFTKPLTVMVLMLLAGCSRTEIQPLPCIQRAEFSDPGRSPYILPYPAGAAYKLIQSYCYPYGGHRNQLAYDFAMPVGHDVIAARAGTVRDVRNELPDDGREPESGQHNHVLIQHDDGTVAFYAHLKQGSIVVNPGDRVETGQRIAASGNSGNTLGVPHLHFGVYRAWPAREGFDVPVNFRNADGPIDVRKGLIPGSFYAALAH
jgi:murein DD-endopeptidase MepM/ murein hydrolase activator NlpD